MMSQRCGFMILASLFTFASLVSTSSNNPLDLQAVLSMGGIKGDVIFSQPQDNGPTNVVVNLTGVNETLTWSIQQLPMIYDGNAAKSCSAEAVGLLFDPKMAKKAADYNTKCQVASNTRFEACAVGDLRKMLGDLASNTTQENHTNLNLKIPTRGPHSIMGRTLVLYSSGTPKACALITPTQTMKTAVAVFKAPVAGFVYLRQVGENWDTSVFVDLFFVNVAQSGSNFTWQINQGVVDVDSSDPSTYCKNLGEMFNPKNSNGANCNKTMPHENCPIGDLTSKHGLITVSVATSKQSSTKAAFTDTNLPLSGANNVIGESIVLFQASDPPKPVACAKIMTLEPKVLKAPFKADVNDGVDGYFRFTQVSPFDPTTTEIKLTGLNNKAQGYHVHAYPSPGYKHLSASDSCSGLIAGDHWNPFDIDINKSPAAGTGTGDEYEIGDLSGKYGSFLNLTSYDKTHTDYNLPLFGRNSIQGRSIVIHNLKTQDNNRRWVCNNLMPVVDPATYFMKATANFTGPTLTGIILIDQYFSSEANTAAVETTIFIDVTYTDSQATPTENHRWDIHKNPVGDDARAGEVSKRCLSLQGIFNPYKVNTEGNYPSTCSPTNMLRCESGDLTKKYAPYKVQPKSAGGRQLYNDVNLPLFGRNSVVGHGITVLAKNMGNDRLGCANIVADSSLFVEKSLEFIKHPFSGADFANVVSKALGIPKWRLFNIRTEKAEVDKCQIAKFGIIGKGIIRDLKILDAAALMKVVTTEKAWVETASIAAATEVETVKWRTSDQVDQPVKKLDELVSGNSALLGKYRPSKDCEPKSPSGARGDHVNIFTVVVVTMATVVVEGLRLV